MPHHANDLLPNQLPLGIATDGDALADGVLVGPEMMRFPGDRFTAIVLCNLATTNPGRLSRSLADIWLFDDTGVAVAEPEAVTATESVESIQLSRVPRLG